MIPVFVYSSDLSEAKEGKHSRTSVAGRHDSGWEKLSDINPMNRQSGLAEGSGRENDYT